MERRPASMRVLEGQTIFLRPKGAMTNVGGGIVVSCYLSFHETKIQGLSIFFLGRQLARSGWDSFALQPCSSDDHCQDVTLLFSCS